VNIAYLGAIAAQVATAGARTGGSGHGPWLLYGAGFVVALAGLIYLSRMAWRALSEDEYTGEDNQCRG